jgi:putative intracellular protease/amidase
MKRILTVLSERGYWGEELVGPLDAFDAKGYEVTFMTPNGKKPAPLGPSMDPEYVDPPLGRPVVSPYYAQKTRAIDASSRLDSPLSLASRFPVRPYLSAKNYLKDLEAYYAALRAAQADLGRYDALLLVGGSGPIVDLVNNQRLHDLVLSFYKADKPIAAECYGVTCLAFARDWFERRSIIWGKHVTGHPLEFDYKDGTGFLGTDFNMGPPPYPLELILRDATGPNGGYHGNVGRETSVILDYPFVTARSTACSRECGDVLVQVLEHGLRRYGW